MTQPYQLGDLIVIGQRRDNASTNPFPERPEPIDGPLPGSDMEHELPDQLDPCDDPVKRREWNLDAVAAKAVKEFLRLAALAGEDGLNYRERGAFIYRKADGSFDFGPVTSSVPYQPGTTVVTTLDYTGINQSQIVGWVHSHPPGQHTPSMTDENLPESDETALESLRASMEHFNTGNGHRARVYIAASNGSGGYQINVYSPATIGFVKNTPPVIGPQVNPDAASCAG